MALRSSHNAGCPYAAMPWANAPCSCGIESTRELRAAAEPSRYDGVPVPADLKKSAAYVLAQTVEVGQPQPVAITTVWGAWLRTFPWEAWGTLTFRDAGYSHDAATRTWGKFVHATRDAGSSDLAWFVGHEIGAQGRLHMHCLLANLSPLSGRRMDLWHWWFTRYGRCEVRGYDPKKGAADYISKYMAKDVGLAHYDLDLSRLAPTPAIDGHTAAIVRPHRDGPSWPRHRK